MKYGLLIVAVLSISSFASEPKLIDPSPAEIPFPEKSSDVISLSNGRLLVSILNRHGGSLLSAKSTDGVADEIQLGFEASMRSTVTDEKRGEIWCVLWEATRLGRQPKFLVSASLEKRERGGAQLALFPLLLQESSEIIDIMSVAKGELRVIVRTVDQADSAKGIVYREGKVNISELERIKTDFPNSHEPSREIIRQQVRDRREGATETVEDE
ncbi:hypothetical protein ACFQY0_20805 [Haloferula chungangensis]|uniref:Uncharacterized protein n=1 Tax=Haloferula chungangensis TaxID=1048331 RepID=A0ABW2LB00_9BACT